MTSIRTSIVTLALAVSVAASHVAHAAPRAWILPSETMFVGSGDEWLTLDAALSTDLYYYDHAAQPWEPVAYAPDGTQTPVENKARAKQRITFDLHVTRPGTYKVAIVSTTVMGSYLQGGERKPLPRGTTPATLAQAVPADATELWSAENRSRLETFATAGEPSTTVFAPTGKGIEMVPVTHPTDLSVGEPATFQFLLDGKPAANLAVSAVNGGVRYSDALQQLSLTTDAAGKVTINWPAAGMWWVNASLGGPRGEGGAAGAPGAVGGSRPAAGPSAAPGAPSETPRPPMTPPQPRASYAMTVEVLG